MSRRRIGWVVVAVVIGVLAAVVGNWWTVAAMVFLVAGQLDAERRDRRREKAEPAPVPTGPDGS